ncbi:hypothetical protein C5167_007843 [Papaver somniferum]|nr:hypothetical protein C5167_007843 [Papaver somniferum]
MITNYEGSREHFEFKKKNGQLGRRVLALCLNQVGIEEQRKMGMSGIQVNSDELCREEPTCVVTD